MKNKAFSQLTDAERVQKFDIAIRNRTGNLLDAGQIMALAQGVSFERQYIIAVHEIKQGRCCVKVDENVLHIFLPEHHNERN